MKVSSQPLLIKNGKVLMVLKRYELDTSALPLLSAREELETFIRQNPDSNATWGYFPELSDDAAYQASSRLAQAVRRHALQADTPISKYPVDLAFVRLAISEPDATFGGFHVDVSPGIAHEWDKNTDPSSAILRILFNVYTHPRRLEFYPLTIDELRARGHDILRLQYKILSFPDLETKTIEIPSMESHALYALQFLSDQVPHAGRTSNDGHFLVSFGGYIPVDARPFG